jgi:hypothetical protein
MRRRLKSIKIPLINIEERRALRTLWNTWKDSVKMDLCVLVHVFAHVCINVWLRLKT